MTPLKIWDFFEKVATVILLVIIWSHAYWGVSLMITILVADNFVQQLQLNAHLKFAETIKDVLVKRLP